MVFGIGLSKTGTTSLARALNILQYNAGHYVPSHRMHYYDAVCDLPVPARYQHLDEQYPNSKFIYTIRDIESWLVSCEHHWNKHAPNDRNTPIRMEMYGSIEFDRNNFANVYQRHDADVREYFANRPDDLLIFDVREGWLPLCSFLQKDVPSAAFPWLNQTIIAVL